MKRELTFLPLFVMLISSRVDASGTMWFPFASPVSVTCDIGCYSGHNGKDYACDEGTYIYSPISGTVTQVVESVEGQVCDVPNYGNYIEITGSTIRIKMAHLKKNSIPLSVNDQVSAGDLCGQTSNTGYTMALNLEDEYECGIGGAYHLHLETYVKNGESWDVVNPTTYNSGLWTNPLVYPNSFAASQHSQDPSSGTTIKMFPGQTNTFTVSYRNDGSTDWKSSGYPNNADYIELVSCNSSGVQSDSWVYSNWMYPGANWYTNQRVITQNAGNVGPGQNAWFIFTARVPSNATIGSMHDVYFRPWHATGHYIGDPIHFTILVSRPIPYDFDGDRISDVWDRTASGYFRIDFAADNLDGWDTNDSQMNIYGGTSDTPYPADYDGDGKCDIAILRDSDHKYMIDYARNGFGTWDETTLSGYGGAADFGCPGDYDGDGKADISVRDADCDWHIDYANILYNGNPFGSWDPINQTGDPVTGGGYGGPYDRPAQADYDGDGKCDFAVLRNSDRKFLIDYSSVLYQGKPFGSWDETTLGGYGDFGDYPCPGDFDGDGKADIAVLWTDDGSFRIDHSSGGFGAWAYILEGYGGTGDRPMAGDFDGDGRDDIGIYSPSVSRVCFDMWNYQATTGWGDWDYCDAGGYHPPTRMQMPPPDEGTLLTEFSVSIAPNPVRTSTTVSFALPEAERVSLAVYDVTGRRVNTIADTPYAAGRYTLVWNRTSDAGRAPSGIYFLRFISTKHAATFKVVVVD